MIICLSLCFPMIASILFFISALCSIANTHGSCLFNLVCIIDDSLVLYITMTINHCLFLIFIARILHTTNVGQYITHLCISYSYLQIKFRNISDYSISSIISQQSTQVSQQAYYFFYQNISNLNAWSLSLIFWLYQIN
jgi:hypothetical protein